MAILALRGDKSNRKEPLVAVSKIYAYWGSLLPILRMMSRTDLKKTMSGPRLACAV